MYSLILAWVVWLKIPCIQEDMCKTHCVQHRLRAPERKGVTYSRMYRNIFSFGLSVYLATYPKTDILAVSKVISLCHSCWSTWQNMQTPPHITSRERCIKLTNVEWGKCCCVFSLHWFYRHYKNLLLFLLVVSSLEESLFSLTTLKFSWCQISEQSYSNALLLFWSLLLLEFSVLNCKLFIWRIWNISSTTCKGKAMKTYMKDLY